MAIRLLSEEVIGKIAAGEVVERPAAAIKELVENSLDAGARRITVEIREGGIPYFRVADDGSGIRESDIRMAFERHATSKITSSTDLFALGTLGFRGEALASIAAVSRVTCMTRTADAPSGLKAENVGGVMQEITEAACPQGTSITVRDLFFNTPVRLKFLRRPSTEAGYVTDFMQNLILCRPDVSFHYRVDGKDLYRTPGDGQLASAVHAVYGPKVLKTLRPVEGCAGGVVLKGYVGIGENASGSRNHESFFVNGRYMRSELLSRALEAACRERVMIGRFPLCVLHLTMPLDAVDVNVHPNKLEVRFAREADLSAALTGMISDALREPDALVNPVELRLEKETSSAENVQAPETAEKPEAPLTSENIPQPRIRAIDPMEAAAVLPAVKGVPGDRKPEPDFRPIHEKLAEIMRESENEKLEMPEIWHKTEQRALRREEAPVKKPSAPAPAEPPVKAPSSAPAEPPVKASASAPAEPPAAEPDAKPAFREPEQVPSFLPDAPKPMRLIGVLFNTFILVEYEDHLLMIDQHAVHERLLFDRFMQTVGKAEAAQEMLVPMVVSVTRKEQQLLVENAAMLMEMGLRVEPFGENEMAIRSVPMILGRAQAADFVREALTELENCRGYAEDKRRSAIMQLACKKAVKGGDALSEADIRYLVEQMVDRRVTPTCPHGRPLVVSLSHTELDKKFRRIQQ